MNFAKKVFNFIAICLAGVFLNGHFVRSRDRYRKDL